MGTHDKSHMEAVRHAPKAEGLLRENLVPREDGHLVPLAAIQQPPPSLGRPPAPLLEEERHILRLTPIS
jgi:hypothetical protein